MKIKKSIIIPLGIILLLVAVSLIYLNPYKASAAAIEASEKAIYENGVYVFKHKGDLKANIIIYQGGLVETRAYSTYAMALSERGYTVFLPKMPLNLAITKSKAFEDIMEAYPSDKGFWLMGHSLGGTSALMGLKSSDKKVDGVILLGSYGTEKEDFNTSDISFLSIIATNDQVMNLEKFNAYKARMPLESKVVSIEGGNHSGFGDYGFQKGDGDALISSDEQMRLVVEAVDAFILK